MLIATPGFAVTFCVSSPDTSDTPPVRPGVLRICLTTKE